MIILKGAIDLMLPLIFDLRSLNICASLFLIVGLTTIVECRMLAPIAAWEFFCAFYGLA